MSKLPLFRAFAWFAFVSSIAWLFTDARAAACAALPPEDGVEITNLPDITSGMKVSDLLAKPPFNDVKSKIELRLIYDEGGTVMVAAPSDATKDWIVDRYAPGFVKETVGGVAPTTKFDGEDKKKLLRTASMAGGGTFKDKGGAVAVIVKKSTTPTGKLFALVTATAALLGLLLGWWLGRRRLHTRPPAP